MKEIYVYAVPGRCFLRLQKGNELKILKNFYTK